MQTAIRDKILYTKHTILLQNLLLLTWLALIVFVRQVLTNTHCHIRIYTRRIDILLNKSKTLPKRLLPIHLDVVKSKRHTRVRLSRVMIQRLNTMLILVRYHILYQLHCWITATTIITLLVLGSDDHILQTVYIGLQLHRHTTAIFTCTQCDSRGFVTHHLKVQHRVTTRRTYRKMTLQIARCTNARGYHAFVRGRFQKIHLNKGQCLTTLCIHHYTAHRSALWSCL